MPRFPPFRPEQIGKAWRALPGYHGAMIRGASTLRQWTGVLAVCLCVFVCACFVSVSHAGAQQVIDIPATFTERDLTGAGAPIAAQRQNLAIEVPGDLEGTRTVLELRGRGAGPTYNWTVFSIRNAAPTERKFVLVVDEQRFAASGVLDPLPFGVWPANIALSSGRETLERAASQTGVTATFVVKPMANVTFALEGGSPGQSVQLMTPQAFANHESWLSFANGAAIAIAILLACGLFGLYGIRSHSAFVAAGVFSLVSAGFMALDSGYLVRLLPRLPIAGMPFDMLRALTEGLMTLALVLCVVSFNAIRQRGVVAALAVTVMILVAVGNLGFGLFDPIRATVAARLGFALLAVAGLVMAFLARTSGTGIGKYNLLSWFAILGWTVMATIFATSATANSMQHVALLFGLALVLSLITFMLASFALSQGYLTRNLMTDSSRRSLALAGAEHFVWDWRPFDDVLDISPDLAENLGYDKATWMKAPQASLRAVLHPDDEPLYQALLANRTLEPGRFHEIELRLREAMGEYRWFALRVRPLPGANRRADRVIGTLTDITRNKVVEDRLITDAVHDPVTGLPSRVVFADRLAREIEKPLAQPVRVLLVALERFKTLNEGLGHDLGDQLLLIAGRRIADCLSDDDAAARLTGSQFAVMHVEKIDGRDAMTLAEDIRRAIAQPVTLGERNIFLSAAIGISRPSTDGYNAETLQAQAASALHESQKQGKASIREFEAGIEDERPARLDLEHDLRRALDTGEIEVLYQPIVSLESREVAGLEALVRWNHPGKGQLLPAKFLSLAEQAGLMPEITAKVMADSLRQMGIWQRTLTRERPVYVAINLSAEELTDLGFVDRLRAAIAREGVRPNTVKVEITESVAVRYPERARVFLQRLQALGVGVACDDFGTGFSSLSSLRDLPFDTLKIDRSFLVAEAMEGRGGVILDTVVSLAHGLGMLVVAEGIETEAQASRLLAMGCDLGQGFHFSEALRARDVEALLSVLPRVHATFRNGYDGEENDPVPGHARLAPRPARAEEELFEAPVPDDTMFEGSSDDDADTFEEADDPEVEPEELPSIFALPGKASAELTVAQLRAAVKPKLKLKTRHRRKRLPAKPRKRR